LFVYSSISHYQSQLTQGHTTCVEAVEHYLRQIAATRHLNAYVTVYEAEALARAKELDALRKEGKATGRLHGVVIGVKDVISHEGHPLTAASGILQGFEAIYSATAIKKLLEEEAIIIGSLNCDEFAMGSTNEHTVYGPVLNADDESRVPGGSSGGSAVAVQAGLCMVSLGSDTGGSVRQPADFCGIVGFKPGYGRISRYGLIAYASSFDQIGIFSTNIPDTALLLEIMAGPDVADSTASRQQPDAYSKELEASSKPYNIAYFPEALDHPSLDPEIRDAIYKRLESLKNEGHQVQPVHFDLMDYIVPSYYVLTTAEASSNLSRYDGVRFGHRTEKPVTDLVDFYKKTRSEGFGKEVKRRIMLGTFVLSAGYYDAYFTRAQKVRKLLTSKIELIFNDFDFIILPTAPTTAFRRGEKTADPIAMYLADIYTVMANLAGIPAISLPLFRHNNGMRFGLQAMASRQNELSLLRFSHELLTNREN